MLLSGIMALFPMEFRKSTRFQGKSQNNRGPHRFIPMALAALVLVGGVFAAKEAHAPTLVEGKLPVAPAYGGLSPLSVPIQAAIQTEGAPALLEAGPPTGPVASPDKRREVGLSVAETLTGLKGGELERQLDDFVALGVTWVRLDFDWAVIQRGGPDSYDWSRIDRVVAEANARGLKLLPILTYTPRWARSEDCSARCPPTDPADFARFASVAAGRYAPQGIHIWEIWNEPNAAGFWSPKADPVKYTELLRGAYLAIKNVDRGARIISGGLAIVPTRNGSIAPREYLAALYAEGAGAYFTAVGFHPYSFPATATYAASWNAWQQMENTYPSLRSIMIANGDRDKQIWITEYGAPTNGPGNASAAYVAGEKSDHVTEERQKEMLIDAITDAAEHEWLGPFFWYSYKDIGTSRSTTENFYGLTRADGSPKPGYDALKALLSEEP